MHLQDDFRIELGSLTVIEKIGLFDLKEMYQMPYEKRDNVWVSVTIERDRDLIERERYIYTIFDFLSDIGGLAGILVPLFAIIASHWNFQSFDDFMAQRLFRVRKPKSQLVAGKPFFMQSEFIKRSSLPKCRALLLYKLRSITCCCPKLTKRKGSRRDRTLDLAFKKL